MGITSDAEQGHNSVLRTLLMEKPLNVLIFCHVEYWQEGMELVFGLDDGEWSMDSVNVCAASYVTDWAVSVVLIQ